MLNLDLVKLLKWLKEHEDISWFPKQRTSSIINTCSLSVRLSQDLAKDLAILAREIHDVAGDGEPQNAEVDSSATVSTVTAHEQVHL